MAMDITRALQQPGEVFPFREEVSIPPQEVFGEEVRFDDPAVLEGSMCLTESTLHIWGQLEATAHGSCAKCLEPAEHKISARFDETILPEGEDLPLEDEDILDADDHLTYDGPRFPIERLALTLAVLDLPIRFLCREDCEGLNSALPDDTTHAGQKELPEEHPFSALQQLLNKDLEV